MRRNPITALSLMLVAWLAGQVRAQVPGVVRQTGSGGAAEREGQRVDKELRVRQSLNPGWRFKRQAAPGASVEPEFVGAEKPGYDDSSWATVTLPHTWDATPECPFGTAHHFRGLGWYRRGLEIPVAWRGRRVWVNFKAAFQVADVWVNGRHVTQHIGGFTGFTADITDFIDWGAPNLLAVRVNDVLDPEIAPANETNVVVYGGLYRSVTLAITDPAHIVENSPRITTERTADGALIHVSTAYADPGPPGRVIRLETQIVDAAGQPVGTLKEQSPFGVSPGGRAQAVSTIGDVGGVDETWMLASPQLWSPASPYLYRVVSTLYDDARAIDRVITPFGVRFMGYDPARGFTLNGEPINLHGVNRRQDYGFLGDAVPESIGVRDVRLMKAMGVNFLRTSHYPQDPAVLDACDRMGILVWEEIPNIKIYMYPPSTEGGPPTYTERFPHGLVANLKSQLEEMIGRDRNHPSIIIWGLADDLSTYHYPEDFVELSSFAHALDPTRWTAGRAPHVTDVIDATSEPNLVAERARHTERKYIWNEWGSFISERGREGDPVITREDVITGDNEAAELQEGYLMQWNALPWLGTAKWCMFDAGEPNKSYTRPLWNRPDQKVMLRWSFDDYMGVADMWRLPKEGYYLLQSQWTEKPMVHIVSHWTWPGEETKKRQVRVYSNCDTVELLLNGRSLGVHRPVDSARVWQDFRRLMSSYQRRLGPDEFNRTPLPGAALRHPPFVWDDVPYEPGTLVAVGRRGGLEVRDSRSTAGEPKRIVLKAEKTTLLADGDDTSFIEADVVDANGVTVPNARTWISFNVGGPARLLGATTEIDAISGVAAINVQSTGQPGHVVVMATAISTRLESGSVRLNAVAGPAPPP